MLFNTNESFPWRVCPFINPTSTEHHSGISNEDEPKPGETPGGKYFTDNGYSNVYHW